MGIGKGGGRGEKEVRESYKEEWMLEMGTDQCLGVHSGMQAFQGKGTACDRSLEAGRGWWVHEPGSRGVWTWWEVTDHRSSFHTLSKSILQRFSLLARRNWGESSIFPSKLEGADEL